MNVLCNLRKGICSSNVILMNMNHLSAPTPVAFCLICDFSTAMMDVSLPCRVITLMVFAMLVVWHTQNRRNTDYMNRRGVRPYQMRH